jgi:CheY-like chemotaxis protein
MAKSTVTYLAAAQRQSAIRWRSSPDPGARVIELPDLPSILNAIRYGTTPLLELERVIIDGGATASEFLNFLSKMPPDFGADIIFVESRNHAFLSAAGPEGRRVLYSLDEDDLQFYCSVYSLRENPSLNVVRACSAAGRLEQVRVLIAEDEPKTRELLLTLVNDLGCQAVIASSGLDAIKQATVHRPQVIFLDGLMPEMHGFEVARIIRQVDRGYSPRIVILTGVYKNTSYRNDAKLRYGVDGYLLKPVSRADIASAIFDDTGKWALTIPQPKLVAV